MPSIKHTALIPPIAHLKEFGQGHYHLVLAHLLTDPQYSEHYRNQARNGSYLTLDNGAAEFGTGLPMNFLAECAIRIGASEIVMPDVLRNREATVAATRIAIMDLKENNSKWLDQLAGEGIGLMIVPQGATAKEWNWCLNIQVNMILRHMPQLGGLTIGVAKWTDNELHGGRSYLINHYLRQVWNKWPSLRLRIHLLGIGRSVQKLAKTTASTPYEIRSVDSAKPFTCAIAGISLLDLETDADYKGRMADYFNVKMSKAQRALARDNVEIFKKAGQALQLPHGNKKIAKVEVL